MANFTHQDTGHNSSASSTSLAIVLSNAVSAGDLLVLFVQSSGAGPSNVAISDTSSNTWVDADGSGQVWYSANAAAAAGGVTITATITGGYYVHQMVADRFTPLGTVTYGGVVDTGSSGTIGLNYNSTGCGSLGTVPAGALAWGAFAVDSNDGSQSYTPGYQTGTTAPADVIGTQFAGSHGTGLSVYVTNCANENATLTWYGTGTGAIGHAGSLYFTASGSSGPQTVNLTTPNLALAAPTVVASGPAVNITTTGSTFSPVIALVASSTATVTWSCSGFSSQTGTTPSFSFGSAATRTVTMTVTGGFNGYGDVTLFNMGYNNTYDVGNYMPSSGYAKSPQSVSGISGVNLMTGLIYFLADQTALTGAVDFTGMSALQFIQCYATNITGVTLTGCTALKRLQVEQANLTTLDLNPVSANLYDLRAAAQQGGTLTFATLTNPMAVEYHYCVRDQTVVNSIPLSQLPVVYEYWAWNTKQSGAYAPNSSALYDVLAYANLYTSANLINQYPTGRNGILDLHGCQLASATLTGCNGLTNIDLHLNKLQRPAVDSILSTVASWGTSNGTLNLANNTPPSSAGMTYANQLTGRGWTVSTDTQSSIVVQQTTNSSSNFTSSVGVGHTIFIAVFAYSTGTAITTSNPVYNFAAAPGAQKILEVTSPNGSEVNYMAIWMLPACGNGSSPNYGLTLSGGNAQQWWAFDVSGLGVNPVVDKTISGNAATGSAANSGSVQIGTSPELILGGSVSWAGESAGPGSPWTLAGTPNDSSHGWGGYQIATKPGGAFSWAQTVTNSSNPWVAGAVTIKATGAVSGTQLPGLM